MQILGQNARSRRYHCIGDVRADSSPAARRQGERGFTIFEVAMASFIMAFGIATSIIALQMGFRAMDVARDETLASQIMQSEIERVRLWPWSKTTPAGVVDSIIELPSTEAVNLATTFASNATVAKRFSVTRTVATDPLEPTRNVRYITIAVTWKSYDGRSHTRTFTTLYSKDGLYDYYYTLAKTS
jgi:Tfp pilus assembly protein PilV